MRKKQFQVEGKVRNRPFETTWTTNIIIKKQ